MLSESDHQSPRQRDKNTGSVPVLSYMRPTAASRSRSLSPAATPRAPTPRTPSRSPSIAAARSSHVAHWPSPGMADESAVVAMEDLVREKAKRENLEASSEQLMRAALEHHFELIGLRRSASRPSATALALPAAEISLESAVSAAVRDLTSLAFAVQESVGLVDERARCPLTATPWRSGKPGAVTGTDTADRDDGVVPASAQLESAVAVLQAVVGELLRAAFDAVDAAAPAIAAAATFTAANGSCTDSDSAGGGGGGGGARAGSVIPAQGIPPSRSFGLLGVDAATQCAACGPLSDAEAEAMELHGEVSILRSALAAAEAHRSARNSTEDCASEEKGSDDVTTSVPSMLQYEATLAELGAAHEQLGEARAEAFRAERERDSALRQLRAADDRAEEVSRTLDGIAAARDAAEATVERLRDQQEQLEELVDRLKDDLARVRESAMLASEDAAAFAAAKALLQAELEVTRGELAHVASAVEKQGDGDKSASVEKSVLDQTEELERARSELLECEEALRAARDEVAKALAESAEAQAHAADSDAQRQRCAVLMREQLEAERQRKLEAEAEVLYLTAVADMRVLMAESEARIANTSLTSQLCEAKDAHSAAEVRIAALLHTVSQLEEAQEVDVTKPAPRAASASTANAATTTEATSAWVMPLKHAATVTDSTWDVDAEILRTENELLEKEVALEREACCIVRAEGEQHVTELHAQLGLIESQLAAAQRERLSLAAQLAEKDVEFAELQRQHEGALARLTAAAASEVHAERIKALEILCSFLERRLEEAEQRATVMQAERDAAVRREEDGNQHRRQLVTQLQAAERHLCEEKSRSSIAGEREQLLLKQLDQQHHKEEKSVSSASQESEILALRAKLSDLEESKRCLVDRHEADASALQEQLQNTVSRLEVADRSAHDALQQLATLRRELELEKDRQREAAATAAQRVRELTCSIEQDRVLQEQRCAADAAQHEHVVKTLGEQIAAERRNSEVLERLARSHEAALHDARARIEASDATHQQEVQRLQLALSTAAEEAAALRALQDQLAEAEAEVAELAQRNQQLQQLLEHHSQPRASPHHREERASASTHIAADDALPYLTRSPTSPLPNSQHTSSEQIPNTSHEEIAALQLQVRALEDECARAKSALATLNDAHDRCQVELRASHAQVEAAVSRGDTTAAAEIALLRQQIRQLQDTITEFNGASVSGLDHLRAEQKLLSEQRDQLMQELREAQVRCAAAEALSNDLRAQHEHSSIIIQKTTSNLNKTTKELEDALANKHETMKTCTAYQRDLEILKRDIRLLNDNLAAATITASDAKATARDVHHQLLDAQEAQSVSQARAERYKKTLSEALERQHHDQILIEQLRQEQKATETRHATSIINQQQSANIERQQLRHNIEQLKGDNARLQSERDATTERVAALEKQLGETRTRAEKEKDVGGRVMEQLKGDNARLQSERDAATEHAGRLQLEMEAYVGCVALLLDFYDGLVVAVRLVLWRISTLVETQRDDIVTLEEALASSQCVAKKLEAEASSVSLEADVLRARVLCLEDKERMLRKRLSDGAEEIAVFALASEEELLRSSIFVEEADQRVECLTCSLLECDAARVALDCELDKRSDQLSVCLLELSRVAGLRVFAMVSVEEEAERWAYTLDFYDELHGIVGNMFRSIASWLEEEAANQRKVSSILQELPSMLKGKSTAVEKVSSAITLLRAGRAPTRRNAPSRQLPQDIEFDPRFRNIAWLVTTRGGLVEALGDFFKLLFDDAVSLMRLRDPYQNIVVNFLSPIEKLHIGLPHRLASLQPLVHEASEKELLRLLVHSSHATTKLPAVARKEGAQASSTPNTPPDPSTPTNPSLAATAPSLHHAHSFSGRPSSGSFAMGSMSRIPSMRAPAAAPGKVSPNASPTGSPLLSARRRTNTGLR